MDSDFGRELRKAREAAGKTQREMGAALGFSTPYISDVERGQRYPFSDAKIREVAAHLGADVAPLISAACRDRGYASLEFAFDLPDFVRVGSLLAVRWPSLDRAALRSIEDLVLRAEPAGCDG